MSIPVSSKQTDFIGLEALALAHGGYFDRGDAHEHGIGDRLLHHYVRSGRFDRIYSTVPRPERGASPAGFRAQLLAHLRAVAQMQAVVVQRLQQRVAFERFLARLDPPSDWTLKGGFALELRYGWEYRLMSIWSCELRAPGRRVVYSLHLHG